ASAFPDYNAVTDLEMKPGDPNTLFAAVGVFPNASNGLYESRDAGQTWALAGNFPSGSSEGRIEVSISKSAPDTMYASVADPSSGGLLSLVKSTDGGTTWAAVTGKPTNYMGTQGWYDQVLMVDPSDPNVVFAGGSLSGAQDAQGNFIGGFLESRDGGATWTDIYQGVDSTGPHTDYHAAAFDANGDLLVGSDGGVWRITDPAFATLHWDDLNGDLSTIQVVGFDYDPSNPSTIYLGAQDNGSDKTTGNLEWTLFSYGDGGYVQVDPNSPKTVYFEYVNNAFYRSDDGGVTITPIGNGLTGQGNFYSYFTLDPNNSSRVFFGTDRINVSNNKGASWAALSTPGVNGFPTFSTVDYIAVAPSNSSTIYTSMSGSVYITTDNGQNWTASTVPGGKVTQIAVDSNNSKIAYAVRGANGGGKVYKTTDGGLTWTNLTGDLPDVPVDSVLQVKQPTGEDVLVVGTDSGAFLSYNGGTNWGRLKTGLPNAQVVQLRYDVVDDILFAGTHGRGMFATVGLFTIAINTLTATPTENTNSTVKLATFQPTNAGTLASDFSARVDWGDGTKPSAGTVVDNLDGTYSVYATHNYIEGGKYSYTLTVSQNSGGQAIKVGEADVVDLPIKAVGVTIPSTYVEGQTYSGTVAQFTDTDPDLISPGAYTVTVDWYAPNSTTPTSVSGTVIVDPNATGQNWFLVNSSHRLVGGVTRIVTTIVGPGGGTATATSYINVVDSALHIDPNYPAALAPLDGTPFYDLLARFTDDDPLQPGTSNYTALVDWGDGKTSSTANGSLEVTADPSGNGLLLAAADGFGHVYSPGVYHVTVTVGNLTGDSTATRAYDIVVEDSAITGQSYSYSGVGGVSLTKILASFVDASPAVLSLDNFEATIDWGDGSPEEPATILINYDGGFVVQGTHAYAQGGKDYVYTINFKDVRLGTPPPVTPSSASVTGTISVKSAPFSATGADLSQVSLREGQTFDGTVATITTPNTLADPSTFSATVSWGDGSTSPATISRDGTLSINGTHTYSRWGRYDITVHLTGPESRFTSTTDSISIQDAPIQAHGSPISLDALTSVSNLKVASFTVSAPNASVNIGDYSAQIGWGDGSFTAGEVKSDGRGGYDVLGSHTYAVSGNYPISVAINSRGGSNTATSTSAQVSPKLHSLTGDISSSTTGTIRDTTPTFSGFAAPGAQVT
ncbi:MAG TPA: hypothetical protein VFT74_06775, partial [Isosphaeraceae bacterium]|nr:hypothetical protein [Isosphaeraceae bacterium]